jgi:exopolysaccharide biosynthesis polyprenyl glycosylphosphotransferase
MSHNEPLADLADRNRSGKADWTLRRVHGLTLDTPGRGSVTEEPLGSMTPAENVILLRLSGQARRQIRPDDVLPRHYFLRQLEREKRRADRSQAPLSMVLFRLDGTRDDSPGDVNRLLGVLCRSKRETDVVGYLSDDRIAVLLPDTDAQGTLVLTRKVIEHTGELGLSTVSATYPDRVFEDLKAENHAVHNANPFFVEGLAGAEAGSYRLKRSLDIVGAIAALLLLSPLMLVIAAAVAASSPGPVIFRQVRLGKRGVPFTFYKFRSMYCHADDQVHREYVAKLINGNLEEINQGEATKPLYKMQDDPRITRVGRLLRKTSVDELPQLFNVLKGDMSLVGPRPPLPYEAEKYQSWHLRRVLEIKPGITGLWQVNGRSKTSFDEMVRLDLRYVRTCSLALDLGILLKTVKVVLQGDGAN